ncbi:hypothetical protein GKC30_04275 [Pseudodesulfovibrio sp. F-1]|uniref:Uncharacterized protein n=1 Tax=Pseudodesulfovibrio alkaliphilus TaxID=2661613 RepID=A0A7K1KL87_9BACT|nr:hypothetical protein [Pseudodesulfovibrio alkaliphilus]MUM76846.1 hypothetical protein [Pseudodesulfovibrio alkaliphilus]
MRTLSTMSNNCPNCVFYRKGCVLGHRRPWNAQTCDDYRPYCLVCGYPRVFCNTCRNLASKGMKPHELDLRSAYARHGAIRFDCVWRSPGRSAGAGH